MNRSGFLRRLWPFRRGYQAQEALFQGLRIRLTLWYCGVLGAALILFGVALYLVTQFFLLSPVQSDAAFHAQGHKNQWLAGMLAQACPLSSTGQPGAPFGQGFQMPEMVVCFDQHGSLLPNENTADLPSAFLSNTVALSALQSGQAANDMVNAGGSIGQIYRYAVVIPNPTGSGNVGVVVIGETVQAQEATLSLLLTLLLSIGGVALFGAGLGGLFLSNRALVPARLAWANQQRFIADASHELRTPLTLIRADAEVLLRGRKRMETEDAVLLEDIVAEAHHMANIATNLLTLARLDTSTAHQEHEVIHLTELAQEAVQRVQALAEQRDITVQVEQSADLYVIGDPMQLEQTVLGLLDNAVKYNRQGGHVIVRTMVQDEQAVLEVRDTGIGIAAEHLPHLGERFYRVDKARSREAGGTGLGLSIARSIAIAHGGRLSLASVPDQGTTVTLKLPLASEMLSVDREEEAGSMSSLPDQTV